MGHPLMSYTKFHLHRDKGSRDSWGGGEGGVDTVKGVDTKRLDKGRVKDRTSASRVDRYVHFSGPIFVYEIHYK